MSQLQSLTGQSPWNKEKQTKQNKTGKKKKKNLMYYSANKKPETKQKSAYTRNLVLAGLMGWLSFVQEIRKVGETPRSCL